MGLMRHGAGETILRERAAAGMRCCIYPKKQFGEKFAAVVVPFGSNDVCWQENHSEKPIRFPLGVAHFIEHKLFQQSWGDALFQFGKQGAAANAFTDGENPVISGYYWILCSTPVFKRKMWKRKKASSAVKSAWGKMMQTGRLMKPWWT